MSVDIEHAAVRRWAFHAARLAPRSNSANRRAVILAVGLIGRRDVCGQDVAPLVGLAVSTCQRYLRELQGVERTPRGIRIPT
jgi:hypothetical protein